MQTGKEPESIDNFDQKPLHVNESGSKYRKTLAFDGGEVHLKECHSATRERWTVNTYATSDEGRAARGDNPLECLFKGSRYFFRHYPKRAYLSRDARTSPEGPRDPGREGFHILFMIVQNLCWPRFPLESII